MKAGLITDVKKDEWKAQFYSVGGSSYLYLKDKNDHQTAQQVRGILASRPAEERKFFTIVDSKMMQASESNPEVAFALTGENGASFGNAMTGEAVKPGHGGAHGYIPYFGTEICTGFVACGPGIKKGGTIKRMDLRNIAPAVAKLLNLSLPSADQPIPDNLFSN
jgi:hypothetical protein